uniref:Glutamate receptor n=1 Tax=Macrostomum lignano TaxID=282301 RepID=A0A1I8IHC4_9PLAT
ATISQHRGVPMIGLIQLSSLLIQLLLISCGSSAAAPLRIPVGAIFDASQEQLKNALFLAVESFKSDRFELLVNYTVTNSNSSYNMQRRLCQYLFPSGAFAVFGSTNALTVDGIQNLVSVFHVPFVTSGIVKAENPKGQDYMLNLRPRHVMAIIDTLDLYKWSNFAYLVNRHEGLHRFQEILREYQRRHVYRDVNVQIIYLSDTRFVYPDLARLDSLLKAEDRKHVVIDLDPPEAVSNFLYQIHEMGMNRREYHYLISGISALDVETEGMHYSGVNVTGFQLVNESQVNVKSLKQKWLQLCQQKRWDCSRGGNSLPLYEVALLMDGVETFARAIDSLLGQVTFDENGFRSNFSIQLMELEGTKSFQPAGGWHTNLGLQRQLISSGNASTAAANFTKVIRVVTIKSEPFIQPRETKPNEPEPVGNDRFEGFCIEMFKKMAERLGIQYRIHFVRDNQYGRIDKKGEWNGMIGELLRNEADIALAPLTITTERAEFVDFTEPFLTFGISIMIKKPKKEKPGTFSFLRPLSPEVWSYILTGCLGVSLGLYLCSRISPLEWQVEFENELPPVHKVTRDFTVSNSFWFSFAAVVNQGIDLSPRSSGTRVVASAWWFFTLIMIAYYTATLAAFLTVELLRTPIDSWEDLAESKEILYGTLNSGSTKAFFLTTKLPPFDLIGINMQKNEKKGLGVYVNTSEDGIRKVRESKGRYAFLLESKTNEFHNNRDPCDTMMVGQPFGDKGYAIATPKKSPFHEKLNDAVLQLREAQVLAQLYKKWWIEKGQCISDDSGGGGLSALTVVNVAGVFYILVAGLGIALAIALVEFYFTNRREAAKARLDDSVVTAAARALRRSAVAAATVTAACQRRSNGKERDDDEAATGRREFAGPVHVHQSSSGYGLKTCAL